MIQTGGLLYKTEDDRFDWKTSDYVRDAWEWPPDEQKTSEEFFRPFWAPGYYLQWPLGSVKGFPDELPQSTFNENSGGVGCVGRFYATLDNYFAHPFGSQVAIPDFDIIPERLVHQFPQKGPTPVRVQLTSRTTAMFPKLLDSPDPRLFWALRVIAPDGKNNRYMVPRDPLGHSNNDNKTLIESLKEHTLVSFQLKADKPYERTIDLRDLGNFDKPGQYKVQLIYSSGPWRDSRGVVRSLDPVAGQPFLVTIQDKADK
jgi:hypothetical protein